MKAMETQKLQKKEKENRHIKYQHLDKTMTTKHSIIPNMTSAYKKVIESNYKPTEEEIHYRRYTSGRPIDSK